MKNYKHSKSIVSAIAFLFFVFGFSAKQHIKAQSNEQNVKISVTADHADWTYKQGEKVKFLVKVVQNGDSLSDVTVKYEVGPEMMSPEKNDSVVLKKGYGEIEGGTMNVPGFLRCKVTKSIGSKHYESLSTAAFVPEQIQPTTTMPSDFSDFWKKAKTEAAQIPIDAKLTLIPERCTENVNVYNVNLQNFKVGNRLYGILCVPKKEGKYPAILKVPGAGVRPYYGDTAMAEKGVIVFEIGIHGIPVTLDPELYTSLGKGAFDGYYFYNLDDRDRYYYKRVYLGCVRAIDFIFTLPAFDGKNLASTGGSQGGALAIVTASLDSRVKYLAAFYPALCDLTGYLNNRAGGWPHMFNKANYAFNNKPDKIETSKYYDVVNFARLLKIPGFYSWGFNDVTCPPTSMYSAYNVITAPKELLIYKETGHRAIPEQREKANEWLVMRLKGGQ